MQNHFHGIIVIVGADPCVCPVPFVNPNDNRIQKRKPGAHMGAPLQNNFFNQKNGYNMP
jgi:hypothetical protein